MNIIFLIAGAIIGFAFCSMFFNLRFSMMLNCFEKIKLMNIKLLEEQPRGSGQYYYIKGVLDGCQGTGEIILGKENISKAIENE